MYVYPHTHQHLDIPTLENTDHIGMILCRNLEVFSGEEHHVIRKGTIKNQTWRNLTVKYTLGFKMIQVAIFIYLVEQKMHF